MLALLGGKGAPAEAATAPPGRKRGASTGASTAQGRQTAIFGATPKQQPQDAGDRTPVRSSLRGPGAGPPSSTAPSSSGKEVPNASAVKAKRRRTTDKEAQQAKAAAAAAAKAEATAAAGDEDADEGEEPGDEAEGEVEAEMEDWEWEKRVERAKAVWAEAGATDDPCSPTFDIMAAVKALSASTRADRTPFLLMLQVLQTAEHGSPKALVAIANLFRQVMCSSIEGERDLGAVLGLLLPRKRYVPLKHATQAVQGAFASFSVDPDKSIADVAQACRARQRTLFQPKRILVSDIVAAMAEFESLPVCPTSQVSTLSTAGYQLFQNGVLQQFTKLLGCSLADGCETRYLVKVMRGETKLDKVTVLRALAHAILLTKEMASQRKKWASEQERAEDMARMEAVALETYGACGGDAARLVSALLESDAPGPGACCGAVCGIQVLPMHAEPSKDVAASVARLGENKHAVLAEWLSDGDRAQIHVGSGGTEFKVFMADSSCHVYGPEDVEGLLKGSLQGVTDGIFEVILNRPRYSKEAADAARPATEGGEKEDRKLPPVMNLFDVLFLNGRSLLSLPLRERRAQLQSVVKEVPGLRITKATELKAGDVTIDNVLKELNVALSAGFLGEREERELNRSSGLLLKRLDGADARYIPARRSEHWQAVRKPVTKGPEADRLLFASLTEEERAVLPPADDIHFCVISGMRTRTAEGIRDIMNTQAMFKAAGVAPKWYVDTKSVPDYCKLGLDACNGGKLIPARNVALDDACKMNKACCQISDDIARWEFFNGDEVGARGDAAANAAWRRAERYQVSPVAAARYILTKIRACKLRPKLGGVYPLGNAARGFRMDACTNAHFILGDFFVVEPSPIRMETRLTLKEDYDYAAAHLEGYGAVVRCNRLVISAKHNTNAGGACAIRDPEGKEERKNIAILMEKWPGAIRDHTRRPNQVVLHWKGFKGPVNTLREAPEGESEATSK